MTHRFSRFNVPPPTQLRRSGQTLIFMAMVILMVAFAALWYFDLNKIFHVKGISNNATDAAALAGARWQAISLNLVGSLNLAQASAVIDALSVGQTSSPESELITDLQRRIQFTGPLLGAVAAQQAAKLNGIHNNEKFEEDVSQLATRVRDEYDLYYPEPFEPSVGYDTAWQEVADMYALIANQGMAVKTSMQPYNMPRGDHILLLPEFYDAINGSNWCWFFNYPPGYDALLNYTNFTYWDPLPDTDRQSTTNPEILSLLLRPVLVRDSIRVNSPVRNIPPNTEWEDLIEELLIALDEAEINPDPDFFREINVEWSFYDSDFWEHWSTLEQGFPWDREIKPEYNYSGTDAGMGVETEVVRLSEFSSWNEEGERQRTLEAVAAAKPFGTLESEDGDITPNSFGLVLPAYTDVRLIPVSASTSSFNGTTLREGWLLFITEILPAYMASGPSVLLNWPGNYFANQLRLWEVPDFRQGGIDWLSDNSAACERSGGPGGSSRSGGVSHGR